MTADEYFAGTNAAPKLISLAEGFTPAAPKEFVVSAAAEVSSPAVPASNTMSDKEYQDGYHALSKENEALKSRVRDLEAQVQDLLAKSEQQGVADGLSNLSIKD